MGIEITRVNADTVQQRHAQTIHLTAVHEYTTVACYQVSRGETGDPPSSKKTKAWAPLTRKHFSHPYHTGK